VISASNDYAMPAFKSLHTASARNFLGKDAAAKGGTKAQFKSMSIVKDHVAKAVANAKSFAGPLPKNLKPSNLSAADTQKLENANQFLECCLVSATAYKGEPKLKVTGPKNAALMTAILDHQYAKSTANKGARKLKVGPPEDALVTDLIVPAISNSGDLITTGHIVQQGHETQPDSCEVFKHATASFVEKTRKNTAEKESKLFSEIETLKCSLACYRE
jgi:hypothetical protein